VSLSLNPPHAPQAGAIQGIIIALTAFLPILAIVSLAPAVLTLIQHFAGMPYVETLVPLMLTAPGLVIAIAGPCTGWLADKFGRRNRCSAPPCCMASAAQCRSTSPP
jgi:MFS family permease